MILRISRGTRRTFSTQEVRRKMIFPHYLRSLHDVLMNEKVMFQSSKKEKQKGDIFFSMEYHLYWLLKGPYFELLWDGIYGVFLSQKSGRNMIYTDYWKIFVLNFSGMGNAAFFEAKSWWKVGIYWLPKSSSFELLCNGKYGLFWDKKMMERLYLLTTENFLFLLSKRSCFEHFGDGKYGLFEPKIWCKGNIYFGFLNCPWYSKTREIRFFVQC